MAYNKSKNKKMVMRSSKKKMPPTLTLTRNVPRPKLSFDGTTLNGTQMFGAMLSAANAVSSLYLVDCSLSNTAAGVKRIQSINFDLASVTNRYTEYRYRSVAFHWIPHVAPGVADGGSPIYIAYLDNPENIANSVTSLVTADIANVKGVRSLKTYNAWQKFTYSVPLTYRLPWFNVNNNTTNVLTEVERATQGAVLIGIESLSAVSDLGAFRVTYELDVRGMTTTFNT